MFLYGPAGTGKTHLVRGLLERVIKNRPGLGAHIISAREMRQASSSYPTDDFSDDVRNCDLLIIEDIQHLTSVAAWPLANVLDYRRARGAAVVVTGINGPATFDHLPTRLTSRLASGLVIGLDPLPHSSRRVLARTLIERRGLHVSVEVLDWLARQPSGGARPILGDIARLDQLSLVHAPPLNLALVTDKLLINMVEETPLIDRLAIRLSEHFGLQVKQLKSRVRLRPLLWPRQVGMYLARQVTDLSLHRIGVYFGGYDHSTVLHACRKVDKSLKADSGLANELKRVQACLL